MNILLTIQTLQNVIKTSLLSEDLKLSMLQKLNTIEHRWKDRNLYVGIVGEFSSGKSTLINSLIGQDYFVTNSLQGTTTVVTSIRYGSSINLELRYKNGDIKSYSKNKLSLIEKYLPEHYSNLSIGDKIRIKAGDFLGMNGKDDFMLKIFDTITTSNEISKEMDEVVVFYPSDFLKNGIILIDTPGTDSLIPMHTEITKSALMNKCNLALVIIPSNSPVSMTLSDFISENLEHCIDYCHFLLTKIELVRKESERNELLNGMAIRLQYSLDIDNPHIIPAPTLLSLEERHIIEPSEKLGHLSIEQRTTLINNYNKDVIQLFQHLNEKKELAIQKTIVKLLADFSEELANSLKNILKEKKSLLKDKQANRTVPLETLLKEFDRTDLSTIHEIVLDRILSQFISSRSNFEREINALIINANSKDDIQGVMDLENVCAKGQVYYKGCFEYMVSQTNWLMQYFVNAASKFGLRFKQLYGIESIEFIPKVDPNSITIRNYNNSFSTSSLSTFPLKRMFIKKESIRSEMKNAVKNYLEYKFEKLYDQYSSKIIKINDKLIQNIDKLLKQYLKKFEKVINARITNEYKNEAVISSQIELIEQHLIKISSITNYKS